MRWTILKRFINTETNEEILRYVTRDPAASPTWSSDSALIVFDQLEKPYRDGIETIHVWNVQTAQEVFATPGEDPRFIGNSYKILSKYYVDSQSHIEKIWHVVRYLIL